MILGSGVDSCSVGLGLPGTSTILQSTIARKKHHKLVHRCFGPFQIMARVGLLLTSLSCLQAVQSMMCSMFLSSKSIIGPPQLAIVGELPTEYNDKALPTPQAILAIDSTTVDVSC